MNWLARLKKIETVPKQGATEPTKPDCVDSICPQQIATKPTKLGYVGFVAPDMAPMQKTRGDLQAANDPAPAASADPDRWCWPHSDAMNTGEIDALTARLARFTDKGLNLDDSEALADRLVLRDRDEDDRRVCLECKHFAGHGPGSWRCGNWQAAGIAVHPRDTRLAADLVVLLQRCDGFAAHPTSTP